MEQNLKETKQNKTKRAALNSETLNPHTFTMINKKSTQIDYYSCIKRFYFFFFVLLKIPQFPMCVLLALPTKAKIWCLDSM